MDSLHQTTTNKKKWTIGIVAGIVIIIGILYLAFGGTDIESPNDGDVEGIETEEVAEEESEEAEEPAEEEIAEEEEPAPATNVNLSETEKQQAAARDLQRVNDIKSIRGALEKYKEKNSFYPESLEVLVPEFLPTLPADPKAGQGDDFEYVYTEIGSRPTEFYDLTYFLEVGAEGMDAGSQDATPDTLSITLEEAEEEVAEESVE